MELQTNNIQVDLIAEATESAIQRINDILRHPDDLTNKLPLVRKKVALEKAATEAQLKTAIELQLDNAARGLDTLAYCQVETEKVKDTLISMDSLCANAQNMIRNYNHIKRTKVMVDNFKKLNEQITRTTRLLDEDCSNVIGPANNMLLVHYQLQLLEKFRNNTMVQARGASVEILSVLSNSFKKVDLLEQSFDKYIWDLAKETMGLLKTGNYSTIVRLIKIIEMEEKFDDESAILDTDMMDENAKSIEMEFTRGRKIKAYRIKFFDTLRTSLVEHIKGFAEQFIDDVEGLLNAANTVLEDLILIHEQLDPLVPPSYNIFRFFVLESHRALYDLIEGVLNDGSIGPGSVLLLLKWVREYYYNMSAKLDVSEDLLEPRLLDGREDDLVHEYISLVRSKLSEWLSNILSNETIHFLARSGPPEMDGSGQYLLAGSVIVFKMFNQQIDVVITSSRGQLLFDVILVCVEVIEQYQTTWLKILDSEYGKFVEKSSELSDGLPEYTMALANDALRSTEFSENIKERIVSLIDDSFKPQIQQKIKSILDGFMRSLFMCQGTFDDYCEDFKAHLNEYILNKLLTELLDKFLIAFIEAFKGKNVKFNMPQAADKLKYDYEQALEFFGKYKNTKRIKSNFEPIEKLIALIEANPRLIYIDFFTLYKVFPDISVDFVEKLLGKRSDLDKTLVKEVMDGIKEKVAEDSAKGVQSSQATTIFSKVNYK